MQFRFWKKNKLVPKVANKEIVVLQKCRILKSLHGPYFKNLININLKFRFCFISSICGMDFIKFQYKLYLDKLAIVETLALPQKSQDWMQVLYFKIYMTDSNSAIQFEWFFYDISQMAEMKCTMFPFWRIQVYFWYPQL